MEYQTRVCQTQLTEMRVLEVCACKDAFGVDVRPDNIFTKDNICQLERINGEK